jgi:hypothetical protein
MPERAVISIVGELKISSNECDDASGSEIKQLLSHFSRLQFGSAIKNSSQGSPSGLYRAVIKFHSKHKSSPENRKRIIQMPRVVKVVIIFRLVRKLKPVPIY